MKEKFSAIYSEDLKKFLDKNGEMEKLLNGEVFCQMCDNILEIDNIQLIIPSKNEGFKYICDRPDCIEKHYESK